MEETAKKMHAGEQLHLCGFCQSYGGLMMAGAKFENFKGSFARVTLMTSSDPDVVAKIHAHAERTIAEHEKWMADKAADKG